MTLSPKIGLLIICLLLGCLLIPRITVAADEKVLFLHHSTGSRVYYEGNVTDWISNYNSLNGTNLNIRERAYPSSPYPWDNYPYDYWKLWINGECNSNDPDIECLHTMAADYDVIIFKHCYPASDVLADTGNPSVSSDRKSLENYKAQYRVLRDLMDTYPNTIFIIWTLPPRHRLATNTENAARAAQFVDWVKNGFLIESGGVHPNIFVFDFWGIVAEQNPNPQNGLFNCLKYEYERDHYDSDSHPNTEANEVAGPLFAERIVNVIESFQKNNSSSSASVDPNGNGENGGGCFLWIFKY